MIHPMHEYENAHPPLENGEMPQTMNGSQALDGTAFAQAAMPANENIAPRIPVPLQPFEANAEESFRIAASDKPEDMQGFHIAGTEAYEAMSLAIRESLEELAAGMNQLNGKLMEFGRVNAQTNMAFVQNVAGVRTMSDAVGVQAAYLRDQYNAAAAQFHELQALTAEIAEKAAAPLKHQFINAAQMFRN